MARVSEKHKCGGVATDCFAPTVHIADADKKRKTNRMNICGFGNNSFNLRVENPNK